MIRSSAHVDWSIGNAGLNLRWLGDFFLAAGQRVCESERLYLRYLIPRDAAFILKLLNEPSFIRFIGDKGARTLRDARRYIVEGPMTSYATNGFGLYLVETKKPRVSIGICGLVKRDSLADIDIGFALLAAYRTQGFGYEASAAVMTLARQSLGIQRVIAFTSTDNDVSKRLLEKIGLRFAKTVLLPGQPGVVNLYTPDGSARA